MVGLYHVCNTFGIGHAFLADLKAELCRHMMWTSCGQYKNLQVPGQQIRWIVR